MNKLQKLRQICNKSPDDLTPQDALDGLKIFGDVCTFYIESGELITDGDVIRLAAIPLPIPDSEALTAALPDPLQDAADAITYGLTLSPNDLNPGR